MFTSFFFFLKPEFKDKWNTLRFSFPPSWMNQLVSLLPLNPALSSSSRQVQTTTMCISVSLSGSVVLGCLFAPKVHIILFQPQKNVATLRVTASRFSATVSASASAPSSSYSKGACLPRTHTCMQNERVTVINRYPVKVLSSKMMLMSFFMFAVVSVCGF